MSPGKQHLPVQRRALLATVVSAISTRAVAQAPTEQDSWPSLARQIFADRVIRDGAAVIGIDAPYRAEDAALVPIGLHVLLHDDDPRHIVGITLVIDQNPSPLAAVFTPGPTSGIAVDLYPRARGLVHQSDGRCGVERRPALRRATVRQGRGRLLGSRGEAGRRSHSRGRNAVPSIPPKGRSGSEQE